MRVERVQSCRLVIRRARFPPLETPRRPLYYCVYSPRYLISLVLSVPCISGTRCTYGATRREIRYSASRALLSNFQIRKFDESGGEFLSHTCYTDRGGGSRGTSRTRIMIAAERACPLRRIRAYVTRRDDVGRAGVDASIDAAFSLVRFALGASPRAMTGEGVATRGGGGGAGAPRSGNRREAMASGDRAQWARSFRCVLERSKARFRSRFPRPAMGRPRLAEDRTIARILRRVCSRTKQRSRNDRVTSALASGKEVPLAVRIPRGMIRRG